MITFSNLNEKLQKPSEVMAFRKAVAHVNAVDARVNEWRGTLKQLMAKFGFKPVGEGNYGAVFENPQYPYIIKVFMKDTAYLKWLDFAKRHQNNPFVPKIKGKVTRIGPYFMAVRLEKLSPAPFKMKYWDDDEKDPNVIEVKNFLDQNTKLLDMHLGNLMARGSQPVLIDPFYNYFRDGQFMMDPNDISKFGAIL